VTGKIIKVGVIGLGVGEQHLIAYKDQPGVEVVSICDIDPDHLQAVADRHDIPGRHTDWRPICENPDIDVVSICSYDDAHAEQCVTAFASGKHVMIEKPVALNRNDAQAVLRAQQDAGRLITSNFILRRSPRFREVKRMAESGEFGEIFCIEGDYIHEILWKLTEGWRGKMDFYCTIYGGGIHLIDLMMWIIGARVSEVSGMGNKILTRGSDYRFDDTFINLLRFETGALGKCLTTLGPQRTKFHSLNVYGTKRTFVNDMPDAKLFDGDQAENETTMTVPYPAIEKGDLLPDFLQAIRENREPIVSDRDVFDAMDVCFAAYEAVQSGKTVPVTYSI
jgi:predicted dehydrogenase